MQQHSSEPFNPAPLLENLLAVVLRAGEIVRENHKKPRTVRHKGKIDLVTETDLAVEAFLKAELGALLPEADFLAEESSSDTVPGRLTWIIDPLDGTTNFAHGLPFVAISVALWSVDSVVAGVVHLPLLGETFHAMEGAGAQLNGRAISVSDTPVLQEAIMATGFPYATETFLENILKFLGKFLKKTQGIRRPGAAALDLAYVACGRYDGFYEYALKPWDTAAGILLVREAGGRVSRYDQSAPYHLGDVDILATNGRIHAEASKVLLG
jgi:myo-inositol-1(or 4)-monophosphatase